MRILVAEDDPTMSRFLCSVLRQAGHTTVAVLDAMQTLMFAMREPHPDAIILDLGMPGGGGVTALKKLQASARTSGIPVIVVTGDTNERTPEVVAELGACAFIRKPVVPELLLAEIDKATFRPRANPPVD